MRAWHPSRRCSTMARTTRRSTHCPGREARGRTLRFHPVRLSTKGRSLSRFTSDPRLEPKLSGGSPWILALAEASAILRWIAARAEAFRSPPMDRCLGRNRGSSPGGSPLGPKPSQFSGGLLFGPKPSAALRWIPVPAEAAAVHLDRWFDRSLVNAPLDRRSDRSPGGSPGSRPGPKPLPFTVRFTVEAEALAVHLSGKSVPAEADRFFSGRKACRPKPAFFPVGSPSKPKLWRLASEAPCRPRPIGFSGPDPLRSRSSSGSPLAVP